MVSKVYWNRLFILFWYRRMNKDISPLKYSSLLSPKNIASPFKKFQPRNINQDQQLNTCSPFKYMNTDANP